LVQCAHLRQRRRDAVKVINERLVKALALGRRHNQIELAPFHRHRDPQLKHAPVPHACTTKPQSAGAHRTAAHQMRVRLIGASHGKSIETMWPMPRTRLSNSCFSSSGVTVVPAQEPPTIRRRV
jgi:hypothetical protein